jgi:hypothetical protein
MTKPEKLKLARLRARLRATGVDVDLQAGVIEGYVLAESRIARLRAEEAQAVRVGRSGPEVRALNVALGEQRRLHQILFGRRSQQAEPMPTPTELAERHSGARGLCVKRASRVTIEAGQKSPSSFPVLKQRDFATLLGHWSESWAKRRSSGQMLPGTRLLAVA